MSLKERYYKKSKLIGLMNAYSQGMSGGDLRFIEVLKRINIYFHSMIIITSYLGKLTAENNGLHGNFIITSKEKNIGETSEIIMIYMKRIIAAMLVTHIIGRKDVIYSSSDFLPDVLPAILFKLIKKVKYIQLIFHIIPEDRLLSHLTQRVNIELINQFADIIIVDNKIVKEYLIKLGHKYDKIIINTPGIDIQKIDMIKPSLQKYDAIFIGRLVPSKGIFDLLKVWKIVSKKGQFKLAIIGHGSKKITDDLKSKITEIGLDEKIDILGYLKDENKYSLLKTSKIFVFPSHEEGFGIAIAEAMACSMPVIAWGLPIYSEVYPKGMMKIPIGDFQGFADAILSILNNKNLRRHLSDEARENVLKYDWNVIANRERQAILS